MPAGRERRPPVGTAARSPASGTQPNSFTERGPEKAELQAPLPPAGRRNAKRRSARSRESGTPGRLQSEMNPSGPLRSGLWNRTGVTTAGWDAPPAIGANRRRAGSPSPARDAHLRHRRTEPEDRRVHPRVERSGRGAPSSDSDAQSVCYRLRPPSEPPGASRRQPQLPCPPPAGCGKSRLVVTNCERGSSPFHTFPPIRRAATLAGSPPLVFGTGKCPREGNAGHRRASRGSAKPVPMTLRCANVRAAPPGEPCALTACGGTRVSVESGQFSRWGRGARLTRRVREEYRVYFDRNATQSAAKRRGSGGMHRRSSPHRENWAAWVSPQAVRSRLRATTPAGAGGPYRALFGW